MIAVGALGVMSFTTNQLYYSTQLVWAMDNLQDMKSYVIEDINNGRLDAEMGESYLELLDETNGFIEDFYEKQCVERPSVEELEVKITGYTN